MLGTQLTPYMSSGVDTAHQKISSVQTDPSLEGIKHLAPVSSPWKRIPQSYSGCPLALEPIMNPAQLALPVLQPPLPDQRSFPRPAPADIGAMPHKGALAQGGLAVRAAPPMRPVMVWGALRSGMHGIWPGPPLCPWTLPKPCHGGGVRPCRSPHTKGNPCPYGTWWMPA